MTCDEVRVASSGLCQLLRGGYGVRLVDSDHFGPAATVTELGEWLCRRLFISI